MTDVPSNVYGIRVCLRCQFSTMSIVHTTAYVHSYGDSKIRRRGKTVNDEGRGERERERGRRRRERKTAWGKKSDHMRVVYNMVKRFRRVIYRSSPHTCIYIPIRRPPSFGRTRVAFLPRGRAPGAAIILLIIFSSECFLTRHNVAHTRARGV